MKNIILLLMISSMYISCNSLPKSELNPRSEKHGIIGLTMTIRGFENSSVYGCDEVYFIKLDNPDELLKATTVYKTNYNDHQYSLLINVEPGKYAVIGATFINQPNYNYVFLTDKNIKENIFEVKEGEIKFIGNYKLLFAAAGTLLGKSPDKTQKYFLKQIHKSETSRINSMDYLGLINDNKKHPIKDDDDTSVKKEPETISNIASEITDKDKIEFIKYLKEKFQKTEWMNRLK